MLTGLFSLAAALSYGAADFFGGAAARRSSALAVLLISTPVGLLLMLGVALVTPGTPTLAGLAWGAAAGTCGGVAVAFFYSALAAGPMTVVAPVSALSSALLPVVVALAGGERPDLAVLAGAVLCLAAIGLVSAERQDPARSAAARRGLLLAVLSGCGFGLFFVLSRHAGPDTGMWPLVTARAAGCLVAAAAAAAARVRPARGTGTVLIAVCSGLLDAGGNACYLLATRVGTLTVSAVLTSLYPAITVLMARVAYRETMRPVQKVGLALAAAGVVLTGVG